jgi:hypothetical protein
VVTLQRFARPVDKARRFYQHFDFDPSPKEISLAPVDPHQGNPAQIADAP